MHFNLQSIEWIMDYYRLHSLLHFKKHNNGNEIFWGINLFLFLTKMFFYKSSCLFDPNSKEKKTISLIYEFTNIFWISRKYILIQKQRLNNPIIDIVLIRIIFYRQSINQHVEFKMANQEKNFKNEVTCLMMQKYFKAVSFNWFFPWNTKCNMGLCLLETKSKKRFWCRTHWFITHWTKSLYLHQKQHTLSDWISFAHWPFHTFIFWKLKMLK